jgi:hypothetical protein
VVYAFINWLLDLLWRYFTSRKSFLLKRNIHSPIKSVELPGVFLRISERDIEEKHYPKMFVSKMSDADGEGTETQVWIDFAHACGYISEQLQMEWREGYEEVGRMLGAMIAHPERFRN